MGGVPEMDKQIARLLGIMAVVLLGLVIIAILSNWSQIGFVTRGSVQPNFALESDAACTPNVCPSMNYVFHTVDIPLRDHDTTALVTIPRFDSSLGELKWAMFALKTRAQFNAGIEYGGSALPPGTNIYTYLRYPRASLILFWPNDPAKFLVYNTISGSTEFRTADMDGVTFDGTHDLDGTSGQIKEDLQLYPTMGDPGPVFLTSAQDLAQFSGPPGSGPITISNFNPADPNTGDRGGAGASYGENSFFAQLTLIGGALNIVYGYVPVSSQSTSPSQSPPEIPTNVSATNSLPYIRLSWNAVPSATQYAVFKGNTPCSKSDLYDVVGANQLIDRRGVTGTYSVQAINPYGYGPCSALASGMSVGTQGTLPQAPESTTASLNQPGRIDLSWQPHSGSIPATTHYRIYRSTTTIGPFEPLARVSSPQTSYSDFSGQVGRFYYYRVKAEHEIWGLSAAYSPVAQGKAV